MKPFSAKQVWFLCEENAVPVNFLWWKREAQLAVEHLWVMGAYVLLSTLLLALFVIWPSSEDALICALFISVTSWFFCDSFKIYKKFRAEVSRPYAQLLVILGKKSGDIAHLTITELRILAEDALVRQARGLKAAEVVEMNVPEDSSAHRAVTSARERFAATYGLMRRFDLVDEKGGWKTIFAKAAPGPAESAMPEVAAAPAEA